MGEGDSHYETKETDSVEPTGKITEQHNGEQTSKEDCSGNKNGYHITSTEFQTPRINEVPSTPKKQINEINNDCVSAEKNENSEQMERTLRKKMSVLSNGSQAGPAMFQDFNIEDPVSVDELENKVISGMKIKWNFSITKAIPTMPMSIAVTCLVLNVLVPGTGTMLSAFASLCISNNYSHEDNVMIAIVNVLVGFAQMSTVFFLLIGWVWSIIWGCAFVGLANRYRKLSPENRLAEKNNSTDFINV